MKIKVKKVLKKLNNKKLRKTILLVLIFVFVGTIGTANSYKAENKKILGKDFSASNEFRIIIPNIGINEEVYEGKDVETLNKGPAHYPDTAFPENDEGNVVISGHAAKTKDHKDPFGRVEELSKDDIILLSKDEKLHKYQVTRSKIVGSKEMSIVDPTKKPTLTLITCIKPDFPRSIRLIIIAEKID